MSRGKWIWHIAFSTLTLCVLIFLSIRASDENRWSDWVVGDAQTMLIIRQWNEGGWITNRFLPIPQGYAKVVQLFDDPKLRHHAHGISPSSSPGVGPRLWGTHYPSGAIVPYVLLFELGIDSIFFMKMLSILFSIGAIVLMYILFSKITSPAISFVAVFFYLLSPAFLGYADSLANQPIDDLLRFAFMLGIVLSTRAVSLKQRRIWMFSAWFIEFLLSLTSLDYILFAYLWLIGWDFLERRGFQWKTYLIYALAPIVANSLHFSQNVWYLGLDGAIKDIKVTLLQKGGPLNIPTRLLSVIYPYLLILLNYLYKPIGLIALLLMLYIGYVKFLRAKDERGLPSLGLLAVLFLCGLALGFVAPFGATMTYEMRQFVPFAAILVGATTWSFLKEFSYGISRKNNYSEKKEPSLRKNLRLLYIISSGIILFAFWYNFASLNREPAYNIHKDVRDISLAKKIKSLSTKYEAVIFDIGGFNRFVVSEYMPGYPQIHPVIEYYSGSKPILCFTTPEGLAADLIYMVNHSPYKFSPLLVTGDIANIEKVFSILSKEGVLKTREGETYFFMDRYILDLTECLKW